MRGVEVGVEGRRRGEEGEGGVEWDWLRLGGVELDLGGVELCRIGLGGVGVVLVGGWIGVGLGGGRWGWVMCWVMWGGLGLGGTG